MLLRQLAIASAVSSTPHCRRCGAALAPGKGAVRAIVAPDPKLSSDARPDDPPWEVWLHVRCAIDVDVEAACVALARRRASSVTIDDERALSALAQARCDAILAVRAARNGAAPAVAPAVERARDPFGRPRGTVAFIGSLAQEDNVVIGDGLAPLTLHGAFASPLREYVLEPWSGRDTRTIAEDPSAPLVAVVFGALADVKIARSQRDKLAALRRLGAHTLVLWVIGEDPRDRGSIDPIVLALRKAANDAGFNGDEAAVVAALRLDADALAALGLALDEQLDSREACDTPPR